MKKNTTTKLLKLCKEGRDLDEVAEKCWEVMVGRPQLAVAKNIVGVVWRRVWYVRVKGGEYLQAVAYYIKLLEVVTVKELRRDTLLHLGDIYREMGNLQQAMVHYEESLLLAPENGAAHHSLALLKIAQNQHLAAGYHLAMSTATEHPFPPSRRALHILSRKTFRRDPESFQAVVLQAAASVGRKPFKASRENLAKYFANSNQENASEDDFLHAVSMAVQLSKSGSGSGDAKVLLDIVISAAKLAGYRRVVAIADSSYESEYTGYSDDSDTASDTDSEILLVCPEDLLSEPDESDTCFSDLPSTHPARDAPSPTLFSAEERYIDTPQGVPFSPAVPCRAMPPGFCSMNLEHYKKSGGW